MAKRVFDRLAEREASWRELDALLDALARPRGRRGGLTSEQVLRLGELYRDTALPFVGPGARREPFAGSPRARSLVSESAWR